MAHFTLMPRGDDPVVMLAPKEAGSRGKGGTRGPMAGASGGPAEGLSRLLNKLVPTRQSVGEVMVFCINNAAQHAALLARRLTASLGEPTLTSDTVFARLYAISDVLYNSNSGRKGASHYLMSLQELLPEACEQLGRVWLRCIEGHIERNR